MKKVLALMALVMVLFTTGAVVLQAKSFQECKNEDCAGIIDFIEFAECMEICAGLD